MGAHRSLIEWDGDAVCATSCTASFQEKAASVGGLLLQILPLVGGALMWRTEAMYYGRYSREAGRCIVVRPSPSDVVAYRNKTELQRALAPADGTTAPKGSRLEDSAPKGDLTVSAENIRVGLKSQGSA